MKIVPWTECFSHSVGIACSDGGWAAEQERRGATGKQHAYRKQHKHYLEGDAEARFEAGD